MTDEELLKIIEQAAKEIGNLTHLIQLSLDKNPLTVPSPEIAQQGTQAILTYLREQL